jgi:hypothetical protein
MPKPGITPGSFERTQPEITIRLTQSEVIAIRRVFDGSQSWDVNEHLHIARIRSKLTEAERNRDGK